MEEISKDGQIGRAAMKADMDRKTARRHVEAAKLPSEMKEPWTWRTRPDPFAEDGARAWRLLREQDDSASMAVPRISKLITRDLS